MNAELEELVKLYTAALEASTSGRKRAWRQFQLGCREIAAQNGIDAREIEFFAKVACRKMQNSEARRSGKPPPSPH